MTIYPYLILSALLFTIGAAGVIIRKNIIAIFLCIELMLNGANLSFIAFAHFMNQAQGQVIVFFVMVVAAAEAAVGLGIILAFYRNKETVNIDEMNLMRW